MKIIETPEFLIEKSTKSGELFYTDDTLTRAYISEINDEYPEDDSRRYVTIPQTAEQLAEHFDEN